MCPTAARACDANGIEIEYYHIDKSFRPLLKKQLPEDEYIYLVNYYGQIDNQEISSYQAIYGNVIIDNVQAFFQLPVKGIDTIYSCRKFFGVPDGAYLYTDVRYDLTDIEQDCSLGRLAHLAGRLEQTGSEFFEQYKKNEKELLNSPIRKMSQVTANLLRGIDYPLVLKKRNENFQYLHDKLQKQNGLSIKSVEGAYMYPLYVKEGGQIRQKLCAAQVYIPLLWPGVLEKCSKDMIEYKLSKNVLPLPVDQRYNVEDMDYISYMVLELLRDY